MFHAIGLAEWHCAHPVLPALRRPRSSRAAAGHELRCAACGKTQFPRTDPAVIMLVTDGRARRARRALPARSPAGRGPPGRFSTLAGFCEPGETLEDAVRREVAEEIGVVVGEVTYFGNQPWPLPASLMLGLHRSRRARPTIAVDGDEIEDARWFTRAEMRARGRGRHAGAARRRLDQPVAGRALVRRAAARPLVRLPPATPSRQEASAASFSLTCVSDGLVCAVPSE